MQASTGGTPQLRILSITSATPSPSLFNAPPLPSKALSHSSPAAMLLAAAGVLLLMAAAVWWALRGREAHGQAAGRPGEEAEEAAPAVPTGPHCYVGTAQGQRWCVPLGPAATAAQACEPHRLFAERAACVKGPAAA